MSAPSHYAGDGIECMDAMRSMTANAKDLAPMEVWWWLCAFKYLWRWAYKGQAATDLAKAKDCICKLEKEINV